MLEKFEGESGIEHFVKEVWCGDITTSTNFLMGNGHSKNEIDLMFEKGAILLKIREYAEKMTAEERYGFWSINC